jgi:hypothetical protein
MTDVSMTCEQAIAAIQKAERVLVFVRASTSDEGTTLHITEFPVAKDLAVAAMQEICNAGSEPNIEISEDGRTVTIGGDHGIALPENSSHFESNNGNF